VFTPLCHERLFVSVLVRRVVVRVFILAKYNSLADKIERVGTATETLIGGFKAVQTGERGDSGVVRGSVIKYEVTEPLGRDTVG
jgi:hypothetical protein